MTENIIPNPLVFREYDIRGKAERDLTDPFAEHLGKALGTFWKRRGCKRIAIGQDCRLSSPRLFAALSRGILSTGIDLVNVGMVPSPVLYFTVFFGTDGKTPYDGGVEITGSHNPGDENGFKMMRGIETLSSEDVKGLKRSIEARDYEEGRGEMINVDIIPTYAAFMRGNISLADPSGTKRAPRFAVDAGNGAGGPALVAAMRAVGLSPVLLLTEPDGRFPTHHPDPSLPESLELLIRTVREQNLDFGIALDGDADRIGVVDDQGTVLYGDRLLVAFARDILEQHPGGKILGEVKCSQVLYDDIAKHGGTPILWKTGHALIKHKMKEEDALLAGEMSGHIFFRDRFFGFDDAIYASLRLVELLFHRQKSIRELLSDLPETFSTPELRVECGDDLKFPLVEKVLEHYRKTHTVIDIDGARILFPSGWGLVRASNTQPILVLRFESDSEEGLREIQTEVESFVEKARLAMVSA